MKSWQRLWVALVVIALPIVATAHEVRPAYLEITETKANSADVLWKQPKAGEIPGSFAPHLSPHLLDRAPDEVQAYEGFEVHRWRNIDLGNTGINGREVSIDGLQRTITDTLLLVRFRDGSETQQILTPAHPSFVINAHYGAAVSAYLWLGIKHILTGLDHLLFVFGLMLLSANLKRLIGTISAFTLAHSITLAASALHRLRVEPPLIEVLVALSIVCLAVELAHKQHGKVGLTSRLPWLIAFAFGLLHGCAFAGALQEIGLPEHNLLLALFLFNVGVELGQIAFVAAAGAALARSRICWSNTPQWARLFPAYMIGSLSVFWLFDRLQVALNAIN